MKDHCYYTEKCGVAAHSICNLRYEEKHFIPVLALTFNIASICDNHLILPEIAKKSKECNFLCVGENTKKYVFFSL